MGTAGMVDLCTGVSFNYWFLLTFFPSVHQLQESLPWHGSWVLWGTAPSTEQLLPKVHHQCVAKEGRTKYQVRAVVQKKCQRGQSWMHELLGKDLERRGNIPGAQQGLCLREGYTLLARQQARRGLGWKSSSRSLQENIQAQDECDGARLYYALPLSISFWLGQVSAS